MKVWDVIVVGAGAAGCFGAIQTAAHFPNAKILLLERNSLPLSKLKISGGGRCNVTNVLSEPAELARCYPRGERFLKKAFYQFSSADMVRWLEEKKVPLQLLEDGCYFPASNDSQTIIDCFLNELNKEKVQLQYNQKVTKIIQNGDCWQITTPTDVFNAKKVLYTIGGQPKIAGFDQVKELTISLIEPKPSLFTFNLPGSEITHLMGVVTEFASVKIAGEKWNSSGPVLITHWGLSGPAVLKCSAYGARILADRQYESEILVNWTGDWRLSDVMDYFDSMSSSQKLIINAPIRGIKSRLWEYLVGKSAIQATTRWSELGSKQRNRLAEMILNDSYQMQGKTTFKEEFVTAGGIALEEVNVNRMELKRFPGFFIAGEAMDIDGITGGFNFQAAWTTSFIAGKSILS
jgi:predicted Rossmann fold flavoprotein